MKLPGTVLVAGVAIILKQNLVIGASRTRQTRDWVELQTPGAHRVFLNAYFSRIFVKSDKANVTELLIHVLQRSRPWPLRRLANHLKCFTVHQAEHKRLAD